MKKHAWIGGRIPEEDKNKIRVLVKKEMFPSFSEFYRTAIRRLLKELETYERKKTLERMERMGKKVEEERRKVEDDMRELIKFIDDLY